jgi:anti-sigma-K factor RskA
MNIENYIASGILELYVAGTLSEKENQEVYEAIQQYPELLDEVLKIELAIIKLTAAKSPYDSKHLFKAVKDKLDTTDGDTKVVSIQQPKINWWTYSGWAAAIILGGGLFWTITQNNTLKEDIRVVENEKEFLEQKIELANTDLSEAKNLLSILRDKNIISIPLGGQKVSPESYAKVYWDKNSNSIYLDAQGLPEPPEGKVYQVWSLTLNPLTPASLGTIDDFKTDDNKIFTINNPNTSEAFGITLEPEGGSESPNLEQLYTLGTVTP